MFDMDQPTTFISKQIWQFQKLEWALKRLIFRKFALEHEKSSRLDLTIQKKFLVNGIIITNQTQQQCENWRMLKSSLSILKQDLSCLDRNKLLTSSLHQLMRSKFKHSYSSNARTTQRHSLWMLKDKEFTMLLRLRKTRLFKDQSYLMIRIA